MGRAANALLACAASGCFTTPDRPNGTAADASMVDAEVAQPDAPPDAPPRACASSYSDDFTDMDSSGPCGSWGTGEGELERRAGALDVVLDSQALGGCRTTTEFIVDGGVSIRADLSFLVSEGSVVTLSLTNSSGTEVTTLVVTKTSAGLRTFIRRANGFSSTVLDYYGPTNVYLRITPTMGAVIADYFDPAINAWRLVATDNRNATGLGHAEFQAEVPFTTLTPARFDDFNTLTCPQ